MRGRKFTFAKLRHSIELSNLSHVQQELSIAVTIQHAGGKNHLCHREWCLLCHWKATESISAQIIDATDVTESGGILCIQKDSCLLLPQVDVLGIIMGEALVIYVDPNLATTDDLIEVYTCFHAC